jgi:hypothetical protein
MAVTWKKVAYEADVITKALLTGTGDLIYSSGVGTPAIRAIGTEGHVLKVVSGVPNWEAIGAPTAHTLNSHTVPSGAVDFDLQVATDLVFFTVANEAALPSTGVALGQPCWATSEKTLHMCTVAS